MTKTITLIPATGWMLIRIWKVDLTMNVEPIIAFKFDGEEDCVPMPVTSDGASNEPQEDCFIGLEHYGVVVLYDPFGSIWSGSRKGFAEYCHKWLADRAEEDRQSAQVDKPVEAA